MGLDENMRVVDNCPNNRLYRKYHTKYIAWIYVIPEGVRQLKLCIVTFTLSSRIQSSADTIPESDTMAAVSTRVICTSQVVHYNNTMTNFYIVHKIRITSQY